MSDLGTVPPLVLGNAAAGSADEAEVGAAVDRLRSLAPVEVVVPQDPADLARAVARAAGRDLVVLGGDGSLRAALQQLHDQHLLDRVGAVGLVPLGTGNDLARTHRLPTDPVAAAEVALRGHPVDLDLIQDERGTVAANVVHAGVAAEATAHAQDVKGLLGRTGYAVGAVRAGLGAQGWRLRVTVDDEVVADGVAPLLMVSLALGRSVGGGTPVAPQAEPGDDLIDVVLARGTGPLARLGFARDLRRGVHLRRADVSSHRGRRVRIEALGGDTFRVNTDGDVSEQHQRDHSWSLLAQAWRLRVPT